MNYLRNVRSIWRFHLTVASRGCQAELRGSRESLYEGKKKGEKAEKYS